MNILILPLYGIGDVLMTTPALRLLKEGLPDSRITCITMFRTTYDVLKGNPHIDSLLYFPFLEKKSWESMRFLLSLRGQYDCSINFYPSNRRQYNLISFLAGAGLRIGHRYEHRDIREFNFLKNRAIMENARLHNVEENVRLLDFLNLRPGEIPQMEVFLTPDEETEAEGRMKKNGRKRIGIHAGTSTFKGHRAKRWPVERFVELIRSLGDCDFFLFGGPDDWDVNGSVMKRVGTSDRLSEMQGLSIRQVAACMKHLDLFVSNDSGLMHLAAAVGIPVVALFGPTNPAFVSPWGVRNEVVRSNIECQPCFWYSPKPLKCNIREQYKCMSDIPVSKVHNSSKDLLQE